MEQVTITFYAAECMEFEGLGKVVESADLKKVCQAYRQMAVKHSHMGCGIGFILHDPALPDYSETHYPICIGGKVDREMIDIVKAYAEHPLVQKAVHDVEKMLHSKAPRREPVR